LVKKPESFDNIADVFKLSLNEMENRFNNLEASVSKLSEKLETVNPEELAELQQRLEDVEDLIMVEQAGILELQKMLVGIDEKFKGIPPAGLVEELQDRLRKMNEKVKDLSESVEKVPQSMGDRLNKLEGDVDSLSQMPAGSAVEVEDIENRVAGMKVKFSSLKDYTEEALRSVNRKIDKLSETVSSPSTDYDYLATRLDTLKDGINILSDKKIEMEVKIAEIDEKVDILNNKVKEGLKEEFTDEIKNNRRDLVLTAARLDSVERIIKNLNDNLREVEKSAKKFEGFEKLSMLNKNVDEKMESFKMVEQEVKRLSNHVETMYETLDRRLSKVKGAESKIGDLKKDLESVKDVVDKTRVDVMSMVRKDDLDKKLDEAVSTAKSAEELSDEVKEKFDNRIQSLEDVQTKIFKQLDNLRKSISGMPKEKVKTIKVESPRGMGKVDDIYMALSDSEKRIRDIETRIVNMERNLANFQEPSAVVEAQTNELIDRFVFLESRLAAIEASMRSTANKQPIILE
jgi:chromosome segregation ATPase